MKNQIQWKNIMKKILWMKENFLILSLAVMVQWQNYQSSNCAVNCRKLAFPKSNAIPPHAAVILDMMSMIHSFSETSTPISYADFASSLFRKVCSTACLLKATRVGIVFDTYPNLSIKWFEHKRIESNPFSFHRSIAKSQQRIPYQRKKHLSNGKNKKELIDFLFNQWTNARL